MVFGVREALFAAALLCLISGAFLPWRGLRQKPAEPSQTDDPPHIAGH